MDFNQTRQMIKDLDISQDLKTQILALSDEQMQIIYEAFNRGLSQTKAVFAEINRALNDPNNIEQMQRVMQKPFVGVIEKDNTPMLDGIKEFLEQKRCNFIPLSENI